MFHLLHQLSRSPCDRTAVRRNAAFPPADRTETAPPRSLSSLAPINVFQRLLLAWEEPHPYNAGQAIRLKIKISPEEAARAWNETLKATGLGALSIHRGHYGYRTESDRPADCCPLTVLPAGTDLAAHFTAELNRPFDGPAPFRPFLCETDDGCWLGMTYQHWVADSIAIRLLLREWFLRICEPTAARTSPFPRPRKGYWDLFGPPHRGFRITDVVVGVLRRHRRYRRAMKVRTFGESDYPVRVLLRYAPDGLIDRLRTYAKSAGVKLNDLFLAAAAEASAKFVPAQPRDNRPDIAVGSIVDMRRHSRRELGETFGFYLGFTEVFCRPGELKDFPKLLKTVSHQNDQHRKSGIAPLTVGWLSLADIASLLVPPHERYHFHRKETPLLAGVSNVNLNGTWVTDRSPDPIEEFIRISPTGPLVPVVFTLTTLGNKLQLSVTVRDALLDEAKANELVRMFLARLERIAGSM